MIDARVQTFDSEEALLRHLGRLPLRDGARAGIMAGHFMLMFDPTAERLVPMVWQDAESDAVREASRLYAGDFPLRTLDEGLRLRSRWQSQGMDARIIFLVNDHRFPVYASAAFKDSLRGERASELKREFYSRGESLPPSFVSRLQKEEVDGESLLLQNWEEEVLGTSGSRILFSESRFRNKFRRGFQKTITQFDGFISIAATKDQTPQIYYQSGGNELCLTEAGGKCGCSGEMVQFLYDLLAQGLRTLVLFVPDECGPPVWAGSEAAIALDAAHGRSGAAIHVVTGVGGAAEPEPFDFGETMVQSYCSTS